MRLTIPTSFAIASALGLALMAGSASAETTISFLHKWPEPQNMAFFTKAVKDFEAAYPDIKVDMNAVADEPYKDKIRVLMASHQVPDVFFSWSGEFGQKFARGGRAMDITSAVYDSDWKDRFSPASLGPFQYNGKQYGVPINVDAKYMLYNKKIFADNGITVPTTFQEFLDDCAKLKKAGVTPIAFGNQYPWAAAHYIGDLFAKLVPDDVRKADYALKTSEADLYTDLGNVKALDAFKTLNDDGYFNRGSNALTHAIARGSFLAGRTAMMYLELVEFVEVKDGTPLAKDGWDFFKLPGFPDGRGDQNMLTGAPDGFMISSETKHPKEAIEFLKFLTSVKEAQQYVSITGMTSSVKGAVTDENAGPMVRKGLEVLNAASGLALWLDTDMDARSTETLLAGSQAIIDGSQTPEQVMQAVRKTALLVQKEREQQ